MTRHTDTDDREANREATTNQRTDDGRSSEQQTMAEVHHTNPMTGETFGDSQVFERGKVAVVDGGEANSRGEGDDEHGDHDDDPMGDVDHTPRKGAPGASEVYDRGVERVEGDEAEDEASAADEDTEDQPDAEADV